MQGNPGGALLARRLIPSDCFPRESGGPGEAGRVATIAARNCAGASPGSPLSRGKQFGGLSANVLLTFRLMAYGRLVYVPVLFYHRRNAPESQGRGARSPYARRAEKEDACEGPVAGGDRRWWGTQCATGCRSGSPARAARTGRGSTPRRWRTSWATTCRCRISGGSSNARG